MKFYRGLNVDKKLPLIKHREVVQFCGPGRSSNKNERKEGRKFALGALRDDPTNGCEGD